MCYNTSGWKTLNLKLYYKIDSKICCSLQIAVQLVSCSTNIFCFLKRFGSCPVILLVCRVFSWGGGGGHRGLQGGVGGPEDGNCAEICVRK